MTAPQLYYAAFLRARLKAQSPKSKDKYISYAQGELMMDGSSGYLKFSGLFFLSCAPLPASLLARWLSMLNKAHYL